MLSVNEIINWERQNPRSEEERIAIRKIITEAITPILTENGFIKSSSSFLRLHGDYLLQSVSVCYRAAEQPSLQIRVEPLFNFMTTWQCFFQGIRSSCGLEGIIAETAAGVQLQVESRNSYLAFQSDIVRGIDKEIALIKIDTIPRLNRTLTCYDMHALYQHRQPYRGLLSFVSHIRHKNADEALKSIGEVKEKLEGHLNELLRIRAIPEKSRTIYEPYTDHELEIYIERDQNDLNRYQHMIWVVQNHRINDFCPMMNHSIDEAYQSIRQVSRRFVKKYPCPSPITNLL